MLDEVDEQLHSALYTWVASRVWFTECTGAPPVVSGFEERNVGHWDSFNDRAHQLAVDLCPPNAVPA